MVVLGAGHCNLEDPAEQGSRLLDYIWPGGGSGQPPLGPDERALNQPHSIGSQSAEMIVAGDISLSKPFFEGDKKQFFVLSCLDNIVQVCNWA